jgi:hypothetical protein
MSQLDFVGDLPPVTPRPFRDIRNTRPSAAEEKAALCLTLGGLCNRIPPSINSASIDKVREWRSARDKAAKVAASKRSSISDLTAAISSMQRFV